MKRALALIGILAVALTACASYSRGLRAAATQAPAAEAPAMPAFGGGPSFDSGTASDYANANKAAGQPPASAPMPSQPQAANRLVIQNAELSIVVNDVNARVNSIQQMATTMGGFIVSVNVYQTAVFDSEPVPQANIVVRVPQEKLDDALNQIKQGTVDVQSETRSGTDVTDQYVDLQSRLKAKQAAEAQLLSIMQEAKRTEDVMAVYSQLQQVQSDIEVLKGQIKYYEQSAALSAISVTIIAEKSVQPIEVGPWKPQGVVRDAIQELIYFWQGFVDFLIRFFVLILPMLITIAIPLFLLFLLLRWFFRKIRKPKTVAVVEEPRK
jgi:hypothetical protein